LAIQSIAARRTPEITKTRIGPRPASLLAPAARSRLSRGGRAPGHGQAPFFDHRLERCHCHAGALFSDNLQTARTAFPETAFHNTGLCNIGGTGAYRAGGLGLHEFTGVPSDMGRFRTPSLRNVPVTAPYMHDGSIATLPEVIRHDAAGGRTLADGPHAGAGHANPCKDGLLTGFAITEAEIADLTAFLESLTDEGFLADPAFADPWPDGHPATANRVMPSH
jgi:cytochrome c peroxidase